MWIRAAIRGTDTMGNQTRDLEAQMPHLLDALC